MPKQTGLITLLHGRLASSGQIDLKRTSITAVEKICEGYVKHGFITQGYQNVCLHHNSFNYSQWSLFKHIKIKSDRETSKNHHCFKAICAMSYVRHQPARIIL